MLIILREYLTIERILEEKNRENIENKTENNLASLEDITDTSNGIDNEKMDISKENLKKDEDKKSAKSILDIS